MNSTPTLNENEIRPDHLMAGQAERLASDIKRLVAKKKDFVRVECPACTASRGEPVFEKYDLSYVRCPACQTVYINPRPTPEILESYYASSENYQYWCKFIFPASEDARREKVFRPRALRIQDIVRRFGVGGGVLLDVGAGFGTFCEEVQRLGDFKRVIGLEPTPELAATCRAKGLEVLESTVEKASLPDDFADVITSFETIEHLFCPRDFLKGCLRNLRKGGLLVLTCPNVMGFEIATLGKVSNSVDVEHLNYFHPESLSGLLRQCGFDVLEVLTPGQLDAELVRKKVLNGEFELRGQSLLHRILIEDWERLHNLFQQFLVEAQLSSHMWVIATVKG